MLCNQYTVEEKDLFVVSNMSLKTGLACIWELTGAAEFIFSP